MKKLFTIPVAFLLLLTGMHVTIASHFCDGQLAATKVSLTGMMASCGMVHAIKSISSESSYSSNCCEDETSVFKVDENFSASNFNFKELTQSILLEFNIPVEYAFYWYYQIFSVFANVSPPDYYLANAVSMADICVFRI